MAVGVYCYDETLILWTPQESMVGYEGLSGAADRLWSFFRSEDTR